MSGWHLIKGKQTNLQRKQENKNENKNFFLKNQKMKMDPELLDPEMSELIEEDIEQLKYLYSTC